MIGKVVSPGLAMGRVKCIRPYKNVGIVHTDDLMATLEALEVSYELTLETLKSLVIKTKEEIGVHEAEIFEAHLMMLQDPTLKPNIINKIKGEALSAASAIEMVMNEMGEMFRQLDSDYMKERALDIEDIKKRWIKNLDKPSDHVDSSGQYILVAEELTPSETLEMDLESVVGVLMERGGITSHTAILAQAMGIPAIVGCGPLLDHLTDDTLLVIDAVENKIIKDPSQSEVERYNQSIGQLNEAKKRLDDMKGLKAMTLDGRVFELAANIAGLSDVASVLENDGDGVGLFRTEFMYMNRQKSPTTQEQFLIYKEIVEKLNGKDVIFRTMDIGGDKEVPYLKMPKEHNPFLGYRAIRYCLKEQAIFKTQLKAIMMASAFGKVKIMFPMIASVSEFLESKAVLKEAKEELKNEGIDFDPNVPVGIMVEIPSAAIQAKQFAKHVDFFSIGTNDLTQYTLAVDRQNETIADLYDYFHPAVLNLIHHVITTGKETNTWVGMCGSAAGDEKMIPLLLHWGIDELSMPASLLLKSKAQIRGINTKDWFKISEAVLEADDAKTVRTIMMS